MARMEFVKSLTPVMAHASSHDHVLNALPLGYTIMPASLERLQKRKENM